MRGFHYGVKLGEFDSDRHYYSLVLEIHKAAKTGKHERGVIGGTIPREQAREPKHLLFQINCDSAIVTVGTKVSSLLWVSNWLGCIWRNGTSVVFAKDATVLYIGFLTYERLCKEMYNPSTLASKL